MPYLYVVPHLHTHLIKFLLCEDVLKENQSERHKEEEYEGEDQGGLGELDDPQHCQTQQLDEGEQVHLGRPHLEIGSDGVSVEMWCNQKRVSSGQVMQRIDVIVNTKIQCYTLIFIENYFSN